MNCEYLHVNSSRWKTQAALLRGRGSSPPPPQLHPLTVPSSSPRQGRSWTEAPRCFNFFFSSVKDPKRSSHPPFVLLHSCVCKIAASNRSVVKLPSPKNKSYETNDKHTWSFQTARYRLSPRPTPLPQYTPPAEASADRLPFWLCHTTAAVTVSNNNN